ncbi:MAG: hypothetical protein OXG79_11310 [Chloroflexi bacterium]|nr:hypothetical protein [Chloroflexota bacterium]
MLAHAGLSERDAEALAGYAAVLGPLVEAQPDVRLPFRARTLAALADQPLDVLVQAAQAGSIQPSMTEADAKSLTPTASASVASVIRPSDSWNFGRLQWPRIDGENGYGYIPGDLYANCLWYYARNGDVVVDPMAGSGMLQRVWDDRDLWLGTNAVELEIVMSDLAPRGPYRELIQKCDLLQRFPVPRADYVILDPPYCEIVSGQYSDLESDLANMSPDRWREAMEVVARRLREAQIEGGRCTVIVPNWRGLASGQRLLFPEMVRRTWLRMGYELYDVVYSSRRIQRRQGRRIAILNNQARRSRVPLTDISEVLTFVAK